MRKLKSGSIFHYLGSVIKEDGRIFVQDALDRNRQHHMFGLVRKDGQVDYEGPYPIHCPTIVDGCEAWLFRSAIYAVDPGQPMSREEIALRFRHMALEKERDFVRIRREVEAFENLPVAEAVREHIPEVVRLFVWQRDMGRCIECQSNAKLEFDHIIPVALGGSNTERNIRLLCESCNRRKGAKIGISGPA